MCTLQGTHCSGAYLKHSIRGTVDLAIVGIAAVIVLEPGEICKDIKIVLGAVSPTPVRAKKAEAVLKGKKIDDTLIEKASQEASIDCCPISDVRASAEYREEMVKVFIKRAIRQAMAK